MRLNLSSILTQPGAKIPFSCKMDFSDLEFGGQFPAVEPVCVSGQVRNEADVVILNALLETTLHCICDRCAAPFQKPFRIEAEAILVSEFSNEENEDDDWVFRIQNDSADLDDILTSAFVLNMESKMLCREDCRGICPKCGKNLNEGECSCKPEIDPRLAVLGQLLSGNSSESTAVD